MRHGSAPVRERTSPRLERGSPTAVGRIVAYRLDKLCAHGVLRGDWLDCGCADGGYSIALAERGADTVVGVDIDADDIDRARQRGPHNRVRFVLASADRLPFDDAAFDGVLLNEVLEHVSDQRGAVREIHRVLRPGGHLALFSPNRWFPFEGHGLRLPRGRYVNVPVPLVPWLPGAITRRAMRARNYWPGELVALVRRHDFEIVEVTWAFPMFEVFRWLPRPLLMRYWSLVPTLERTPGVRRLGVSTLVIARKAGARA